MGKVKYKKISKDLESIVAPVLKEQHTRRSIYSESVEVSEHYFLSVDSLIPFKFQARRVFSEQQIEDLSRSIQQHGIRQPLTVIASEDNKEKYEVVSGERRLRAAKKIGLTKVPCIVIKNYSDAEEIALIENIQREDLHPIEIGRAFKDILSRNENLTNTELASKIGVSKQYLSDCLSYCKIPEEVQKKLIEDGVKSRDFLRIVLKEENPEKLFIKNADKPKKISSPLSLLRVTKSGDSYNFQFNGLQKIDKENIVILKRKIDELFIDIMKE